VFSRLNVKHIIEDIYTLDFFSHKPEIAKMFSRNNLLVVITMLKRNSSRNPYVAHDT